jgi:acyl carrier protein
MQLEEVIGKFQEIFQDTLDNKDIEVTYDTTASDIEEWDSLTHIQLVVAIEKYFKVKFTSGEIEGFKNVGEMSASVLSKIK